MPSKSTPPRSSPSKYDKTVLIEVHTYFASHPPEVIDVVLEYARDLNQLDYLLRRFKLSVPIRLHEKLEVLNEYATRVGSAQFLMRARFELWKSVQHAERARRENSNKAKHLEASPQSRKTDPVSAGAAGAKQARAVINSPGYRGPDRRHSLGDRRSHYDRRNNPIWMMRDKRSRSDRRAQPWGRRKTDCEQLI